MMLLLDREWVSRRRFIRHIVSWVAYCLITLVLWFLLPSRVSLTALPIVLAIVFMAYAVRVARKVFLTFRRTIRRLDDYYSDDGAAYIRWMSVFTYWAVFFGAGQGVFTFVPDRYVYVWIISAIPFIYIFMSRIPIICSSTKRRRTSLTKVMMLMPLTKNSRPRRIRHSQWRTT